MHRWQPCIQRQAIEAIGMRSDQRVDDDIDRIGAPLERSNSWFDIFRLPDFERHHFDTQLTGCRLDLARLRGSRGIVGLNYDRESANLARNFAQQFDSLACDI